MQKIMFWIYDHIFGASLDRLLRAHREDMATANDY